MTVDWISIGIALASALLTHLLHTSSASAAPTTTPTPAPAPTPASGGLFHGGLLNRLRGNASAPATTPTSAPASNSSSVAPVATSHPVINSLLSILESEINSTQGQQLLNQLSSALITLTGANGQQVAVQAGSQTSPQPTQKSNLGGTTNATSASSPVSAGS